MAIVSSFFKEVRDQHEENGDKNEAKDSSNHSDDALLQAVIKYFEKGCASEGTHWPEFIRIILKSKRYSFAPLSRAIEGLCDEKLAGCQPETYQTRLSYDEKLTIFETLVDGLHDLDDFKSFLNQRIEERTSFNKQKMDLYAEIKGLEAQKLELQKEHQENNVFANSEALLEQIEDLKKKLESASRVDSKRI